MHSVIDTCWEESGIFGEGAVHTILGGKHVKRGVYAHVETYQALLSLYCQSFFEKSRHSILLHRSRSYSRTCESHDESFRWLGRNYIKRSCQKSIFVTVPYMALLTEQAETMVGAENYSK